MLVYIHTYIIHFVSREVKLVFIYEYKYMHTCIHTYCTWTIGVVGWDCGYFKGLDGCETRFNSATTWWNKCRAYLQSNKISVADIFNSSAVGGTRKGAAANHCIHTVHYCTLTYIQCIVEMHTYILSYIHTYIHTKYMSYFTHAVVLYCMYVCMYRQLCIN